MLSILTQIIFLFISSFVSIYIVFDFMTRMFGKVQKTKTKYVVTFVGTWLLFFASNILSIPFLNIGLLFAIPIFVGVYLFNAGNKKDFFLILLLIIFFPLSEIISQLAQMVVFSEIFSIGPGHIFEDLMIFLIYRCAMFFVEKYVKPYEKRRQPITIVVVPIISLYILATITFMISQIENRVILFMAIWGCILLFVLNMFVYYLFDRISILCSKEERLLMKEQQAQMQNKYFLDLERKYESTRKLFHDIKRHVHLIECLYEENSENSKAREYVTELLGQVDKADIKFHTNNQIINILVNDKIAVAKYNGIKFIYNCEDVEFSFIQDIDLVTMLSNLLDNAFEACMEITKGERVVELCICQINDFLLVNVSNSCRTEVHERKGTFKSTKAGHLGIGLSNVKDIVKKYDGTIEVYTKQDSFTVQISFLTRK